MAPKFQTGSKKASDSGKKSKAKDAGGADLGLAGGATTKAKPESIKLHFDELMKKKRSAASSNQKVRAQNAVAKKDNVDTNLLSKVVSWADRDPGEVHDELKEMLRYVETCLPEVQLDLFEEDGDGSSITREAQIFDQGDRAGRDARKSTKDNPHQPASIEWFCWDSGYAAGQKKNASLIGKTAPIDSKGPVPGAKDEEARH